MTPSRVKTSGVYRLVAGPASPLTFCFFLLLLSVQSLSAQSSTIRFEHISTAEGLSQDIVKAILQDSQGFMWFGTEDGLNRYDGYSMKIFKHQPRDTTSISNNDIHDVYEDSHRRLWIGTGGGLNLINREQGTFTCLKNDSGDPQSISNSNVTKILEDAHGKLWVGTSNGLNAYDERTHTFRRFFHDTDNPASINSNDVHWILRDRTGKLWVATANGFCSVDETTGSFRRYLTSRPSVPPAEIKFLFEDHTGTLWISQTDHGLWLLDPGRSKLAKIPTDPRPSPTTSPRFLADAVVNSLTEDDHGRIWIGHFRGLDVYDTDTKMFDHFLIDPATPNWLGGRVNVLYKDNAHAMWLGTYQNGVYRHDPNRQKFSLFRIESGPRSMLESNYVSTVLEDRKGTLWIGTEKGLDRIDARSNNFRHYRHNPHNPGSIDPGQVNAILEDKDGTIWLGLAGQTRFNLDRFDRSGERFSHYPVRSVRSLYQDRNGELWAGLLDEENTGQNLVRFDRSGSVIARYSVPGTGVWCIYQDHSGNLWLGGQYCCLSRLDVRSGTIRSFDVHPDDTTMLASGAVRTICEDETGALWFGTWGGGLFRYMPETNRFSRVLESDGLPSNYVKSMLPDGHGNLWIGTERGLARFNLRTGSFRNFTTEDGVQGDRFLSGSSFKTRDGRMYFGGTEGLNMFHPDSVRDNPNVPPVVITTFKVFDTQMLLPPDHIINLSHDQDFFSFEFVALDYTAPLRNQYAYMLEGFDRDWVKAGTRRYASYTGVDPGMYLFKVRGSNSDGVWNNEGAVFRVVVAPPFWRTWWFGLLAVGTVLAALYFFYRYRLNQALAIERLRSRIADDLHDDVGTDLSTIVLAAQAVEHKYHLHDNERDELRRIGRVALKTQEMMRDIVWVLNSKNDKVEDLMLKMKDVADRTLSRIPHTFDAPKTPLPERTSLEFKRNVFLFYKECLNNVVKHAAATSATIAATFHDGEFSLRVTDNGKGFHPEAPSAGIGLASLRSRASQLGGTLVISSSEGSGTTILLTVKTTQMRHSD